MTITSSNNTTPTKYAMYAFLSLIAQTKAYSMKSTSIRPTAIANPTKPPKTICALTVWSSFRVNAGAVWPRKPPTAIIAAAKPVPLAASLTIDPTGSTRRTLGGTSARVARGSCR
jgi:hypothetical protein